VRRAPVAERQATERGSAGERVAQQRDILGVGQIVLLDANSAQT
jgi:hypothetical protein